MMASVSATPKIAFVDEVNDEEQKQDNEALKNEKQEDAKTNSSAEKPKTEPTTNSHDAPAAAADSSDDPEPNEEESFIEKAIRYVWNPETGEFRHRTLQEWARIGIYYASFYLSLVLFWMLLWLTFYRFVIPEFKPRCKLENSLIGTSPGLGFRPMPPISQGLSSSLIWYSPKARGYKNWTDEIHTFLKPYREQDGKVSSGEMIECSYDITHPFIDKACRFSLSELGNCSQPELGYELGKPCVFLKLNKIIDWVPEYFNDTVNLPDNDMPTQLVEDILFISKSNQRKLNSIWVSCEGEHASDREYVRDIEVFPKYGFPGYYFPYTNKKHYLSPLVAVSFGYIRRGVLVNIECKAWAKNIIYNKAERRGSVHFKLMIDPDGNERGSRNAIHLITK